MQVIDRMEGAGGGAPCSLALGTFDGVHRGHMAVIRAGVEGARQGLEPGAFTFGRPPQGGGQVVTARDKRKLLERAGVVEDILFEKCGARRLCCGEDYRFGRGAAGDVALLRRLCDAAGVQLRVAPPVLEGGEKVSSTRIREAIGRGDILTANRLLGRPFSFSLEVIHGNHIGTGLGTPTINPAMPEGFVQARFGVYAAWCRVSGEFFYGVTNIGVKPTVGSDRVLAETWMPAFSGDLYGRRVRVFLLDFIRPEKKFASLEGLKAEIRRNAEQAEEIAARARLTDFGI